MKTNIPVNELFHLYNYNQKLEHKNLVSICTWCRKLGNQSFTFHTDNGDLKNLCNEVCFNQYRRASFKRKQNAKIPQPSINSIISDKKSKSTSNETEYNHQRGRKIISPYHSSTAIKFKSYRFSQNLSIRPPFSMETNHVSYPLFTPSVECILPTFIRIPVYFPIQPSCIQCSMNIVNQECQTERTRRISI